MNAGTKEENDRAGRIWEEGLAKYPDLSLIKVKLGFYHWTNGFNLWADDVSAELRKANAIGREVLAKDNLTPQVKRLAHMAPGPSPPFDAELTGRRTRPTPPSPWLRHMMPLRLAGSPIVPIMGGKPQKRP